MDPKQTVLVVIDVQGKLASLVYEHDFIVGNIERMINIARIFDIPILWTEQAPQKIGATIAPIADLLNKITKPLPKVTFSCFADASFARQLASLHRLNIIVVGIETHVCVYQTARDLKIHGYNVFLLEDAVSSRTKHNKDIAVNRMRQEGVVISSVEMTACELLHSAAHPKFKEVMVDIKR